MSPKALTYAWTVIAIGVTVLACAVLGWQSSNPEAFLLCFGLAALAATFKMKLPKLTGTLSPAFVFVLVSVVTRSWSETVVIAALSGIVQCLWRPKKRPTGLQMAFNAATMAIAGAVAHGMARILITAGDPAIQVAVLGAAGVSLLVTNTLILSTILCLLQEAPFMTVWRSIQLWAVPYYLAGGVLANIWSRAGLDRVTGMIVLAASSAYLINVAFQELGRLIGQTILPRYPRPGL
jgi:hypothetical protein